MAEKREFLELEFCNIGQAFWDGLLGCPVFS